MNMPDKFKLYALAVLLWAGIYLPPLGVFEINFNESRRIYPAITMLETGNWAVPVFEGEEYFKKPPMINWMIASSFVLSGGKSEFAARLPSALCILMFITVLMLMKSDFMDCRTRFIASIIFLTAGGIVGKGMICEIEASYISFTGAATIGWLALYSRNSGQFKLWCIPALFLGICLLIKGPISLLFYYAMIASVFYCNKDFKKFFSWGHLAGIAIMLAIFSLWAYNTFSAGGTEDEKVAGTWISEMMLQFRTGKLGFGLWFKRVFGSIANFAPWIIFIPLFMRPSLLIKDEKTMKIFKGCCIGLLITLAAVNAMPGTKARYSMPLIPLASVLTGLLISKIQAGSIIITVWNKLNIVLCGIMASTLILVFIVCSSIKVTGLKFAALSSKSEVSMKIFEGINKTGTQFFMMFIILIAVAVALLVYLLKTAKKQGDGTGIEKQAFQLCLLFIVASVCFFNLKPVVRQFEENRPAAKIIDEFMPASETLHVYKVGCEPFFFYMRNPWVKSNSPYPDKSGFFLCKEEDSDELFYKKSVRKVNSFKIKSDVYGLYEM